MLARTLPALLLPAMALALPPGPLECERLVAAGAFHSAVAACAGQPHDPAALEAAVEALAKVRTKKDAKAAEDALKLVSKARKAAPEQVIEEAFAHHAARHVRAALELDQTPRAARLPLPAMPTPGPTLPPVDYQELQVSDKRIQATEARIRETRLKVAEGAPPSLKRALAGMERERGLLLTSHLAALEDALQQDRTLPPIYWLHLARAYFAVDAKHDDTETRRARGLAVLQKLRKTFPNDGAAGVAALWQAGFAMLDGDSKRVRALLDEAGPFDPDLTAWLEALVAWHAGDHAKARAAIGRVREEVSALLRAHAAALRAELEADPLRAAKAWGDAAAEAPDPDSRDRATLRAAAAWGDALVAGSPAPSVPAGHREGALQYLLSRGQLDMAVALFQTIEEADHARADLPDRALQLVDALRARGEDAAADGLLVWAARRFLAPGPWKGANGAATEALGRRLADRIDARLQPAITAGLRLGEAEKKALGALVDIRTTVLPPDWDERLRLIDSLGRIGFGTRANVMLKAMVGEARGDKRLPVARALVTLNLRRAREAGLAGKPVGPFLYGPAAKRPIPPEVRALIDAWTQLIGLLPPETDERDALLVDRAIVRVSFGDADAVLDNLRDVAGRRLQSALGGRAIYLLSVAHPPKRAEYDALKFARRRAGDATREQALITTYKAVYKPEEQTTNLFRQRLFINAARAYARIPEPWAEVAAAVSYTLALHGREAIAAWRKVIATHTNSPLLPDAHRHLAALLEDHGDLREAAKTYEALATRWPDQGADAMLAAIRLRADQPKELGVDLEMFVRTWPDHPEVARVRERVAAMTAGAAPLDRPSGPPPPAQLICNEESCATTPFWPPAGAVEGG